jgi:hypothetical protein
LKEQFLTSKTQHSMLEHIAAVGTGTI